jgi:hypothetical protein
VIDRALELARKDTAEWWRSRFFRVLLLLGFANVMAGFSLDLAPRRCEVAVVTPAPARAEAVYERLAEIGHPLRRVSTAAAAAALLANGEVVASVDGTSDELKVVASRSPAGDLAVDSVGLAAERELRAKNRDALEEKGVAVPRIPVAVALTLPGVANQDVTPLRYFVCLCWVSGFLGAVIGVLADADVLGRLARTYTPFEFVLARTLSWTALGIQVAAVGTVALVLGGVSVRSLVGTVLVGTALTASAVPIGIAVAFVARGISTERAQLVMGGLLVGLYGYLLLDLVAGQAQGGSLVSQPGWLRPLSSGSPLRLAIEFARAVLLGSGPVPLGRAARLAAGILGWSIAASLGASAYLRRASWNPA